MSGRQMTLVAFLQAQNCALLTSSWRQPATQLGIYEPGYYQRLARVLEDGMFHLAFFDDRLAMPDMYNGDHRIAVRNGIRAVKLDPIPLLTVMGMATRHLGLGATYSTTYYEPYHVARVYQTLDHMVGGRAAWNIVTSLNESEATNFGRTEHLPHEVRYDRADEFVEAVLGHWNSWDDDALVMDKVSGHFAHESKVRRLNYQGKYIKSSGPFTVPRSPQGHPVLIQAGQSGRGVSFAARWAEISFCVAADADRGRTFYKKLKSEMSAIGRDPDGVKIIPAFNVVVSETRAKAEDMIAQVHALARDEDTAVILSESLGFDFGRKPLDEPLSEADLSTMTGVRTFRDRYVEQTGKPNPSTRELLKASRRGTLHDMPLAYGTPKDVADELEHWFTSEACDGFAIPASILPGSYEDFTRLVTPELQRRGLLQTKYAGTTLRANLGLPAPPKG